jgi:hypothetical protein
MMWWIGADALFATILFLLWPDPNLLVVFTGIHILILCITRIICRNMKINLPRLLPGLPILLVTEVV